MHAALKKHILFFTVGLGDVKMGLSLANADQVRPVLASMSLLVELM